MAWYFHVVLGPAITLSEQRDRSLQKLRDLTTACLVVGAGLVAALSVIAATTIPGHSDSASTGSTQSSGDGSLQGPSDGSFGPGGGYPTVVTGGSR
ncbi:MAG TPA: hypothetical protein VLR46_02410 [Candidatus Dormibacteraeota bacterium]|nr:hypothetical protein [Candidatus Dormibacteraeota bacterium]